MPIIDFRNTKRILYNGNEINEVWFKGERVWIKPVQEVTILQSNSVTVRKYGVTIFISIKVSDWRNGQAENIKDKYIYFDDTKYTISLAEANNTSVSIRLSSGSENVINGRTYNIKIVE